MKRPLLVLVAILLFACDGETTPDAGTDAGADAGVVPLDVPPRGALAIVRRDDGTVDVADDAGTVYLRGARAEALVREGDAERTVATNDGCAGAWAALSAPWNDHPRFADGEGFRFDCEAEGGVGLRLAPLDRPRSRGAARGRGRAERRRIARADGAAREPARLGRTGRRALRGRATSRATASSTTAPTSSGRPRPSSTTRTRPARRS